MALAFGTRLGAYEITGTLGVGGMGEVYRATDTNLKRDVAIKVLPTDFAQDADRLARFRREAEVLASLNHPSVAHIYGLERSGGTNALVMELVEGPTLADRIAEGPIPPEEALGIAMQIADALEAAHERGIVHRDLKPANIKLRPDGAAKVLDFGIAKALEPQRSVSGGPRTPSLTTPAMTEAGILLGTAAYMSPEQARGKAVDKRADIWAFGCVLYEMLTGQPAFGGEDVSVTLARVLERNADLSALSARTSPAVRQTIELCLHKDLNSRMRDIGDVKLALGGAFDGSNQSAAGNDGAARSSARRVLPPVLAASVLSAVLAGFGAWSLRPSPERAPLDRFAYAMPAGRTFRNPFYPVISIAPDGRRFVYNATGGLYLRSMDELEATPIPGTEESLSNPFFSADGQSVAYLSGTGQLKRISIGGGAPVVVADGLSSLYGPTWEPDDTILFGAPEGIFRVSADGGKPELVIPAAAGERLDGPELLPDGDSVLFSVTNGKSNEAQVVAQSLSTGKRTALIDGGGGAHYVATGHLIYVVGDRLFAVAFDADTLTVSGAAVRLVQDVMGSVGSRAGARTNYGVSNDGTLVYIRGRVELAELTALVWVDRDGREEPLGLQPCRCNGPSVSPDGAAVAVSVASPHAGAGDIWVWSLVRPHTFTRLTFEGAFAPFWAPDSSRIGYSVAGKGIWARKTDGTGVPEQLVEAGNLEGWAWSADGDVIFSRLGNIDVVAAAGGQAPHPLLATRSLEHRAALSPDGRWLAYESDETGETEIYVRPYPDVETGTWQVSSGGGEEPKWSRDGHTLFYLGPTSLMETAVREGTSFTRDTPKAVLDRAQYSFRPGVRRYDVSPDGQRFLLLKPASGEDAEPPQIVVVTNWLDELARRVPAK